MKITFTLLNLFLLLSTGQARAQNKAIDSLHSVLSGAANDSIKIIALADLSWEYRLSGESEKAIEFAGRALKAAKKLENKHGIFVSFNALGNIYLDNSDYSKALEYFEKCLKLAEGTKDKEGVAISLNNMGNAYSSQSEYSKALKSYYKSLAVYSAIGKKGGMSSSYNNIGNLFMDQEDFAKALYNYKKSLKIDKELNDQRGVGIGYNNIAGVYRELNNYSKAKEYYLKSLEIKKELQHKPGISSSFYNLGELYLDLYPESDSAKRAFLNNSFEKATTESLKSLVLDSALSFFELSAKIDSNLQDQYSLTYSLSGIGKVWAIKEKHKKAIGYFTRAADIAESIGAKERIQFVAENLYSSYKALNKSDKALFWYEKAVSIKDSIFSLENQKEFGHQEAKHEYEKEQVLKQAEHKKELSLLAEQRKLQKAISYSVAIGLALVVVFSGVIVNRLRITRKQKSIIEDQKVIVEIKNKEILDSIAYAKRLQEAILPPDSLIEESLPDSFVLYLPKDIVAGDFYWLEQMDNLTLLAAADCTGHGVPGAIVSVVCSNALNRTVKEFKITEPGKILDKVRELVIETFEKSKSEVKDGMDISLCTFNKATRELSWAGANNPLWIISKGELQEIKADKQPIGIHRNSKKFTTHKVRLYQGDIFYLFTDGLADQFGGINGKKFKSSNLKKLLVSIEYENMKKQKEIIADTFDSWRRDLEQVDDICLIGVRV